MCPMARQQSCEDTPPATHSPHLRPTHPELASARETDARSPTGRGTMLQPSCRLAQRTVQECCSGETAEAPRVMTSASSALPGPAIFGGSASPRARGCPLNRSRHPRRRRGQPWSHPWSGAGSHESRWNWRRPQQDAPRPGGGSLRRPYSAGAREPRLRRARRRATPDVGLRSASRRTC